MGSPSVSGLRGSFVTATGARLVLHRGALMAVCMLLSAFAAHAQSAEDLERARVAYARGQECYRNADYAAAQEAFEEAYRAVQNPIVLVGIAESQVKQERWATAIETFERYLKERPDAPNRGKIFAQIQELKALSIEQGAPAATVDANVTSEPLETHVHTALSAVDETRGKAESKTEAREAPVLSHAVLIHENKMSRSYTLVSAVYKIDGKPVFMRSDEQGGLAEQPAIRVFDAELSEGPHKLDVELSYRGEGFGLFSYMRERKFSLRSTLSFTTRRDEIMHVTAVAHEQGGPLVPHAERPRVRFVQRAEKAK